MKNLPNIKFNQIIREFWKGLRPQKALFIFTYSLIIVQQGIEIFIPIYYKRFFDTIGKAVDKETTGAILIKIALIILAFHLITWFLWRFSIFLYLAIQTKTMARLKQNCFNYMEYHSYSFFTNNFAGSLVQKVNRFVRSYDELSDVIVFNIIPVFVSVVGSVIITWFVAPKISIAIIVWVIIFLTFNISFSRWKLKYDIAVAEADSKATGYLADVITNANAVSFFNGYKAESIGFKGVTDDQYKKAFFSWSLSEIVNAVQGLLIVVVEFFVFYFTIKYWQNGLATIGTFVLAQTYIIGLASKLWGLNSVIRKISISVADAKEMVGILNTPHEIQNIPAAKDISLTEGAIEFEDVGFNFADTRQILNEVNLKIKSGEKIAIIGPSGAGKTTLVRLIMRVYDLTHGKILIDQQDIHTVTQESLREIVSFVPQDPVLFHRTLLENIRYGRREATDSEVIEAAKLAHCDEFIDSLPQKYETFVGERGIKLSGGERQRVAIARAILKKAPILILDEATSSLDSHSETLIQDALTNLMKNCTTIVIAHRLSTIRKMDRIISMQNGKIVEMGTHDELANKDGGLYKKLWDLQVGGFIQE